MIAPQELLLVLVLALLLFGPSKLPGLARSLGSSVREFRRGLRDEPVAPPRVEAARDDAARPGPGA